MQFPPPPGLAFLAYMSGSISKAEWMYLVRLWEEKYANRNGNTVHADSHNSVDLD